MLPVVFILWGELIVECGRSAVDAVGRGGAAVLSEAAVREVEHGAPLVGLQVGSGDQARDGHRLFP